MAFSTHEPASFEALEQILQRAGALTPAAEAHGSFCGLACILGLRAEATWVAELLAGADADDVLTHECASKSL